MNKYYINARLFPTLLTSVPLIYYYEIFLSGIYHNDLQSIFTALPIITDISISTAIIFSLVQINRLISKEVFQRFYFNDELNMPTTNYLLKSNSEIDVKIKSKIELKINHIFDLELYDLETEKNDELAARKAITYAVSQIRNILRNNPLLLQHNIEYGFFRNLLGGSFLALLISILGCIIIHYKMDGLNLTITYIFIVAYLIPIILSKYILNKFGKYYAKILFEQFLFVDGK